MKTLPRFLLLVLLFSIPLWLAASFFDATKIIPVKLPFSALQFLSVLLAAIIVTRQNGNSIRELLLRGIDIKRLKSCLASWYFSTHATRCPAVVPTNIVEWRKYS